MAAAWGGSLPAWGQWTNTTTAPTGIYYNGGNVGIGTPNPAYQLDVNGPIAIEQKNFGGSAGLYIIGNVPTSDWPTIGFGLTNSASATVQGGMIAGQITGNTAGSESMDLFFSTLSAGSLAERMRITRSGSVGIGTTNPPANLTVNGNILQNLGSALMYNIYWNGSGWSYWGNGPGGTLDQNGNGDFVIYMAPSGSASAAANLRAVFTVQNGGNVGIGLTNPPNKLSVAGTIGAQEVIVAASGADYVFAPDYQLRDLDDLSAFIQRNHHLPEIPSAAEVQQKGVSLGDMQTKLLAKVEELTLHMIQEHDRNDRLEAQNRELLRQNREIQDRLSRLEPTATAAKP
jgi:hypothetical protein